jgi:hypothetical protein
MAKQFDEIDDRVAQFIAAQKIFFVASAAPEGRVNVSPKGMATFRVLSPRQVAYLDVTGSGAETAAHLGGDAGGRLTVMFCAFEGAPLILRLYGLARALPRGSEGYRALIGGFDAELPGSRQIVVLDVDLVQTSCGFGVPLFSYQGDRDTLVRWAEAKGEDGLEAYWREKNTVSIDGLPTGLDAGAMRRG